MRQEAYDSSSLEAGATGARAVSAQRGDSAGNKDDPALAGCRLGINRDSDPLVRLGRSIDDLLLSGLDLLKKSEYVV